MKNEFSRERIYMAARHVEEVIKILAPVFGSGKPDFLAKLGIVKMILDDVYNKEK